MVELGVLVELRRWGSISVAAWLVERGAHALLGTAAAALALLAIGWSA